MSEPKSVLYHVQILRLIAASAILISHAVEMFDAPSTLFWRIPWSAGVTIFFVISGFIMTYLTYDQFGTLGAPRRFLLQRATRIVPPYWFFTLALLAVYPIVGWQMHNNAISAASIISSLLFVPWPLPSGKLGPILSQGWTLNYEAFFYVAFGLALLWRRGILLLPTALLLLVLCHDKIPKEWFLLKFWSDRIILSFVAGIVLALIRRRGFRLGTVGMIGCAMVGVVTYILLGRNHGVTTGSCIIAAGFILAREPERLGQVRRILRYGGDISYTVYLSHTIVIGLIDAVWLKAAPDALWLGVAVSVIASLAFASIFYSFVESPATRALRRRLS